MSVSRVQKPRTSSRPVGTTKNEQRARGRSSFSALLAHAGRPVCCLGMPGVDGLTGGTGQQAAPLRTPVTEPSRGTGERQDDTALGHHAREERSGDPGSRLAEPPFELWLRGTASIGAAPPAPVPGVNQPATATVEQLAERLVRRASWGRSGARRTLRLELGGGRWQGGTLVFQCDGDSVSLSLDVPPGVDANHWSERLRSRLRDRGVEVDEVSVT